MCTAVSYKGHHAYFGRNLDLERGYGEKVVITPRNFELKFRCRESIPYHYAMIGMAAVVEGEPLYFEATNEKGLSIAGLNFPKNAYYYEKEKDKDNITPFEFIPWILGQCEDLDGVKEKLKKINLVNISFSKNLPLSPLHWIISDKEKSISVETVASGMKIYDNPFEVLANNPPFDYHEKNMNNYLSLTNGGAVSCYSGVHAENYCLGLGAVGLPGDFSSPSRFARAFFVKQNSVKGKSVREDINQFFHIMNSVAMPKGCVASGEEFEYTRYTSCCDADAGIYYYTTYDNLAVTQVNMWDEDLSGNEIYTYDVSEM